MKVDHTQTSLLCHLEPELVFDDLHEVHAEQINLELSKPFLADQQLLRTDVQAHFHRQDQLCQLAHQALFFATVVGLALLVLLHFLRTHFFDVSDIKCLLLLELKKFTLRSGHLRTLSGLNGGSR